MSYFYETCRNTIPSKPEGYVTDYDKLRDELKKQLQATELELHRAKEAGATIATMLSIIERNLFR
jgi:hypothetical protein